jgi:hypothetical protein
MIWGCDHESSNGQRAKLVSVIFFCRNKCISTRWLMLNVLLLNVAVLPCAAQTGQLAPRTQGGCLAASNQPAKALYEGRAQTMAFDQLMRVDNKVDLQPADVTVQDSPNSIGTVVGDNVSFVADPLPTAQTPSSGNEQAQTPTPASASGSTSSPQPSPNDSEAHNFRRFTADFGGGWTWAQGGGLATGINFRGGAGWLLSPQPQRYNSIGNRLRERHWSLYLVGEFTFIQSGLTKSGLQQAIQLNPALSSATSATGRYYSATADPNLRYCVLNCRITLYVLGGFGWMRRTVEFNGPATAESPVGSNATVASFNYDSAAYDVGGGVTLGPFKYTEGLTYFVEVRRLQGFGSNGGSTLLPLSFGIRW